MPKGPNLRLLEELKEEMRKFPAPFEVAEKAKEAYSEKTKEDLLLELAYLRADFDRYRESLLPPAVLGGKG